ncbi:MULTISPECIES: UvrB/UvrC motif-containing protein [unclassified Listeria]|uniref:UvrB/UvrC motif-containing protein n=1 Tax=unclassified Listeria TaxID=2642072 RepID=UPI000B594831|nr:MULTISPECIES: UvrB/UvrC motif-containing protein [unclassified Listeria]
MLCEKCGKNEAVTRIQELHADGTMSVYYLCEDCAIEGEMGQLDTINDLALEFLSLLEEVASKHCAHCGLEYAAFQESKRLGCAECYESFAEQLAPTLRRVQNGHVRHIGKVPKIFQEEMDTAVVLSELSEQLQKMVEMERFEEAARLRDQIRDLKSRRENLNGESE